MPDYKALYFKLFHAQNKAIEILVNSEREAEEMVLDNKEPLELSATESESSTETTTPKKRTYMEQSFYELEARLDAKFQAFKQELAEKLNAIK